MSQIETLRSMEVNEKLHGITMNLGEFLKTVLEGGFFFLQRITHDSRYVNAH